jgi:hypothetical protein
MIIVLTGGSYQRKPHEMNMMKILKTKYSENRPQFIIQYPNLASHFHVIFTLLSHPTIFFPHSLVSAPHLLPKASEKHTHIKHH